MEELPTAKTEDAKAKRNEIFDRFDPNGNGYLSLAECDKGMSELENWSDIPKPVLLRAFMAAKGVAQQHGNNDTEAGESFVERSEFRLFLVYLERYKELWDVFASLDTGDSDGNDSHADRRIDENEFARGVETIQSKWGVTIDSDPAIEFQRIDTNQGGKILFDEFSAWAMPYVLNKETES